MPYTFENRIVLGDKTLDSSETTRVIHHSDTVVVTLWPEHSQTGFKSADWLMLRGEGFPSSDAAFDAGKLWRQQLSVAFAKAEIGADFDAVPVQHEKGDRQRSPEARGLRVYLQPQGTAISISGRVDIRVARLLDKFLSEDLPAARRLIPDVLNRQLELAYTTFHMALATTNPEIRYILFVTAIEALIADTKPEKDDKVLVAALKELQHEVEDSERWDAQIRDRIGKVLEDAQKKSIVGLGKELAGKLDSKKYDGKSPKRFFDENYGGRSAIVHGNTTETKRPEPAEIARRLPHLKEFVLDLLTRESEASDLPKSQ
ncbi:zinc-binding metallopeptidase family protein [Mycobacteroides salmoniphilum]|uniref:hypothetical protein n=1 Tax=Mycobacteroides salmoniphilum TaxID=404941 RepID=UPI0012FF934D|nr:hypothetical protein [Mycobacteroides salmoniphilum]